MEYYIAIGTEQRGPFPKEQLLAQGMRPDTLAWTDGMGQWQRADSIPDLAALFASPPFAPQTAYAIPMGYAAPAGQWTESNINGAKIAAGICGILLGALGIHKFILGMTGAGLTMLLISVLSCGFGLPI